MDVDTLIARLATEPLVTDGAMGTLLQAAGLACGQCGEQWNVTHRQQVQAIHRAYLEAGSDAVLTNTFGANRFRLREYGLQEQVVAFNHAAAELAREVAHPRNGLVFGDIGPSGQLLEPYGTLSEAELMDVFAEQAGALVEGGVDALIIETMTACNEMVVAIRAARRCVDRSVPVIASFSFNRGRTGYRTMMGETIDSCVQQALEAGADIVGSNCGLGIEDMIGVVTEIRSATNAPIIAQPNAGLPEMVGGQVVYRQSPQAMAEKVHALLDAGAQIIGGCCGTNAEYIRLAKQAVIAWRQARQSKVGKE